jgi:hypothetical protein
MMPIAALACLIAAPALAQTTPAAPAAESAILPAVPAPESGVTDAEVDRYAAAALAVQRIERQASPEDADKPQKMAAAVEQTGLSPTRFNEIAKAQQGDPALQARIQEAAAERTGGD